MDNSTLENLLNSWQMTALVPIMKAKNISMSMFVKQTDEFFESIIPASLNVTHNFLKNRRHYIEILCTYANTQANQYPLQGMGSATDHASFANVLSQNYAHSYNHTPVTSVGNEILLSMNAYNSIPSTSSSSTSYAPNSHALPESTALNVTLNSRSSFLPGSFDNSSLPINNKIDAKSSSFNKQSECKFQLAEALETETVNNSGPSDIETLSALVDQPDDDSIPDFVNNQSVITELFSYKNKYSQVKRNMRLFKLLEKSLPGLLILYSYAKEIPINTDRLCQITVDDYLFRTVNGSLPLVPALSVQGGLPTIAREIELLFDTEREDLYFTGGYKVESGERVNARGLLLDYWTKQVKKELDQCGFNVYEAPTERQKVPERNEVEELNLDVLCNQYCPSKEADVIDIWQRSHDYRRYFLHPNESIDSIYNKWKVLHNDIALKLIRLDFIQLYTKYKSTEKLYFEKGDCWQKLSLYWPEVSKKIIAHVKAQELATLKPEVKSGPKKRRIASNTNNSKSVDTITAKYNVDNDEHAAVLAFTLIHKALNYTPQQPKQPKSSQQPKPKDSEVLSTLEDSDPVSSRNAVDSSEVENAANVANSDVVVVPAPTGLQTTKNASYSRTNILASFLVNIEVEPVQGIDSFIQGLPNVDYNHPYVLIVGPFRKITASYVVFKNHKYLCASPTEAVDICFKWFHVFRQKYPHICQHLHSFLQVFIYGIEHKKKKIVALTKILQLAKILNAIKL